MKKSINTNLDITVHTVLYNDDGFTIAYVKRGNNPSCLAMKWKNGSSDISSTSSKSWFHLPSDKLFTRELVKGIMQLKSLKKGLDPQLTLS